MHRLRTIPLAALSVATLFLASCDADSVSPPDDDFISIGKWGGDNNGAIVTETGAHIHIGCTYGDVVGRVALDDDGKFDVEGSYLLRAFPIAMGPTMPAQFVGTVRGSSMTLIIAVNDTVENKIKVLGPVTIQFGKDPTMGPCPICVVPGMRPAESIADLRPTTGDLRMRILNRSVPSPQSSLFTRHPNNRIFE